MKRVFKKISGVILVLVSAIIWCIYSYEQSNSVVLTNSGVISRCEDRMGCEERKRS